MSPPWRTERVCLGCGYNFLPRREGQSTCSVPCRNRVTARRSAAKRGDALRGRKTTGGGKDRKLMGRAEHRVMAEVLLGRPLREGEVVHHLDGDHSNNNPYNVIVMPSASSHARLGHDGGRGKLRRGNKRA